MELFRRSLRDDTAASEPAMSSEDAARRRNLEMQLEAWQDSEEFEERFMSLFNKVSLSFLESTSEFNHLKSKRVGLWFFLGNGHDRSTASGSKGPNGGKWCDGRRASRVAYHGDGPRLCDERPRQSRVVVVLPGVRIRVHAGLSLVDQDPHAPLLAHPCDISSGDRRDHIL